MTPAPDNLVELATRPIPGDRPAGENARYEPEFDALKAEIDKISALGAAEVDWSRVSELATALLASKSKDVLVLSYLCLAAFQTRGYGALADGVEAVRAMSEAFWDGLYPEAKRMRGRISAFAWLAERCALAVAGRRPTPGEAEAVERALERLDALASLLSDKLGSDAPSFSDWKSALKERKEEAAAPKATPAATRPTPAARAASSAAAPAVPAPGELATPEGREQALKVSMSALGDLAGAMRDANPQDSVAYKLSRIAAWSLVRATPPNTNGLTSVPPAGADADVIRRLDGLLAAGDYASLLSQSEGLFENCLLWLDLQRYSVLALEGLGPGYAAAARVVRSEVRLLLQAHPGLLDLRFASELPFASEATRSWISSEILGGQAGAGQGTPAPAAAADDATAEITEKARELARKGKPDDAVRLLEGEIRRADGGRRKFLLRTVLAGILTESKEPRLAAAQMEAVDDETRGLRLEEWEPELAVEALKLHLHCQRALARAEGKRAPDIAQRAEEIYQRLARLDVAAARAMKG